MYAEFLFRSEKAHQEDQLVLSNTTSQLAQSTLGAPMDPSILSTQSLSAPSKRSTSNRTVSLHRCRFPSYTPSSITALALTPSTYDASELGLGGTSGERGVLAVGRSNGTVELMVWGGYQGWVNYRVCPTPILTLLT